MRLPRGIRARLTLGLLLIVGGALVVATALVVPFLERQLVDAKLDQLDRNAERTANSLVLGGVSSSDPDLTRYLNVLGAAFGARIVLFDVYNPPLSLAVSVDTAQGSPGEIARDPVALAAAARGSARGRVTRDGVEYAESATALVLTSEVVLLSSAITDQLDTVHVVRARLLYATLAALIVAGALGAWAAGIHAGRIRRIERAAERIAQGHFEDELLDPGDDELGQLADSFERMRTQLRQLDLARKEFVANASHELRTPLFSLAGFLELLADEELDEPTRERFLASTREQVDRLTRLAADLLDLSRLDAGQLHVEPSEIDLLDTADLLQEELAPIAATTRHELRVELPDQPVWALADEARVLQIGRVLLSNALTHTPSETSVVVSVGADAGVAWLRVRDTGPGIGSDELERIFQRFYRGEGGRAHGSGLGLAIARELAVRMNGALRVESRSGLTVFTLELPVSETPAELASPPLV